MNRIVTLLAAVLCTSISQANYDPEDVVLGMYHSCLPYDSGLTCWGKNDYGQTDVPADITIAKSLAVSINHTCAIDQDDKIRCWGADYSGQVSGVPEFDGKPISLKSNRQANMTCALSDLGEFKCWGGTYFRSLVHDRKIDKVLDFAISEYFVCLFSEEAGLDCIGNKSYFDKNPISNLHRYPQKLVASSFGLCSLANGEVRCAGNSSGSDTKVPRKLGNVIQLVRVKNSMCAWVKNRLRCWGRKGRFRFYDEIKKFRSKQIQKIESTGDSLCISYGESRKKCFGENEFYENQIPVSIGNPFDIVIDRSEVCVFGRKDVDCRGKGYFWQESKERIRPHLKNADEVAKAGSIFCAREKSKLTCYTEYLAKDSDFDKNRRYTRRSVAKIYSSSYRVFGITKENKIFSLGHSYKTWDKELEALDVRAIDLDKGGQTLCAITPSRDLRCFSTRNYKVEEMEGIEFANVQKVQVNWSRICALNFEGETACWNNKGKKFEIKGLPNAGVEDLWFYDQGVCYQKAGHHQCAEGELVNYEIPFQNQSKVISGDRVACTIEDGLAKCIGENKWGQVWKKSPLYRD